jgi:uncharacterized protein (DUF952 family)
MMERFIYKICARLAWEKALETGHFAGSRDDVRDGYIHLSTASQLDGTLSKHFAGQSDLLVITVATQSIAAGLRWETSSGGRVYPHFYGRLPAASAVRVAPIAMDAAGRHTLPEGYDAC